MKIKILILFFLLFEVGYSNSDQYYNILKNLKKINNSVETLPVLYNQMCQSGYFTMPSAKMADSGMIAFCYSNSDPYKILVFNLQYFDRLEISMNFWIYKNVVESCFGYMGYGEDADRAANFKLAILTKKDGFDYLPEIAIGINDFYGSKRFNSKYIVLTKQFINSELECSFGLGQGRINGFFAALAYFLFFKENKSSNFLAFFAEYDANDYKNHKFEHLKGKKIKTPINVGINLQLFNIFQASISSLRGSKIAGFISANYNLGLSKGLFPKFYDPPMYTDNLKINYYESFSHNLVKIFNKQGFNLTKLSFFYDDNNEKVLCLKIVNLKYRNNNVVRLRIQNILTFFPLDEYSKILVSVESNGLILHEYLFKRQYLNEFKKKKIGLFEIEALCPLKDVCLLSDEDLPKVLYERKKQLWILTFRPKMNAFFGSCRGKFKYDGGFLLSQEGYFWNQFYYNIQASYVIKSASAQIGDRDTYNPSQIINVRSDFTKYFASNSFHIETGYIQKFWNLNKAFFCRFAMGYFEVAYAGIAFEALYYPVNSNLACSIECANVYKRKYSGLGFQKKIRKWNNCVAEYEKFIGLQYFFNLYYQINPLNLTFKTSLGQFLAKDKGLKLEIVRYFKSGFEVSTWITFTNKFDKVNNKRYFDKGFAVSVPLDIFLNKSSKKRIVFKISEWLRDVGAKARNGKDLYPIIHDERYFP
jgi:hypothetical protein